MKIDEILNNVKVEWKQLGEIADITGAGVDKKIIKNEQSVVLLNYLDVYNNIYLDRSIPKMVVTASEYKIKTCNVEYGDIFITPSSETVEDIFRSAVAKENMQGVVYSYHIMRIRLKEPNFITACYLNYLFTAEIFRKPMFRLVNGNTRKTITKSNIENLQIPVPPLVIQEKIVKILDKFTNYATELQTELQLRTKQYEYYRNLLLSKEFLENMCVKFDDKPCGGGRLETKMLGEICEILDYKRKPITKSKRIAGKYPYYGANGVQDYVDDYIFDGTFILMGEDGSVMTKNFTPVLHWVKNSKIWVNNHAHIFKEIKNKCNLRYVYFYLSIVNISDLVKGVPPKLNQGNLRNIKILIPPLQIQEKIVQILDKFSDISSNLEKGLPKEIDLRQKEYEFYRDRLLNFKKD